MEKTPIPAPLRSTTPNTYRSVPTRPADADLRPGEYVTPAEIEKLIKAARVGPLSTPTCCDTPPMPATIRGVFRIGERALYASAGHSHRTQARTWRRRRPNLPTAPPHLREWQFSRSGGKVVC
jgi:hypothetical protein